jgi:hypothetical protein
VSRRVLLACLLALAVTAPAALADNWPQWRGPHFNSHCDEKNVPTEWGAPLAPNKKDFASPPKNVVWQFKMPGRGASTPCIWDDRIFLTAQTDTEVVALCVGTDGKPKWQKPIGTPARYGQPDADNATASCICDGKHVWAFAGSGKLVCFDLDGNPAWDLDVQKYGKFGIQFGIHWTPVLYQGKLYMQVMHKNAQKLVKLDAATGKEEWAVDRKGDGRPGTESLDVYASANIWEGPSGPLLIAHGNDTCTGHKLTDGSEVWRVAGLNPTNNGAWRFVSAPMVSPDLIVVPSCKDGPTVGFNPVGATGTIAPENKAELWRIPGGPTRNTPDVVTPLRVGDVVYILADGPLTARDAKTGQQIYRQNVSPGIHRANMLYADGKVYCVSREGATDVVQTGEKFKIVATNTLPDYILASPAVSNGRIYLRGWNTLWAIGTK